MYVTEELFETKLKYIYSCDRDSCSAIHFYLYRCTNSVYMETFYVTLHKYALDFYT